MPHVITYTWKAFHCELCKEKLEDTFEINGVQHQIFEVKKPASNFIVIESYQISSSDQNEAEKQR